MGKSKKKFPTGTWTANSQKCGKQFSHRRFRRKEKCLIQKGKYESLPYRQYELTNQWDLGGDGKAFYGFKTNEDWYAKAMRK